MRTGTGRALPPLHALQDPPVGGQLSRVVEVRKRGAAPSLERLADQVIGQVGVLRQQAAVQVGADDAVLDDALGAVAAVVASAVEDLAQRCGVAAEEGSAAVVLETDEGARLQSFDVRLDHDVSDEALLAGFCFDVDEADAVISLAVGGLVVVAEQLVAAADGEDLGAVLGCLLEVVALVLDEVVVDERLLAVLATAEEEDVDVGEVVGPAALNFFQFWYQAAPFRSFEQREDVAAVAVDVHQVGVEPADRELLWFAAHVSQYGCAQPRLTSSALRSSIAV